MHSIGDLSQRTGVKIPTIRYYEQMGLLEAPERTDGNQRRYSRSEVERLAFVKHARDLGISLGSIRELIELSAHPDRPCTGADRIARNHLAGVRERIAKLQRLEAELERVAGGCASGNISDCYVIRALSDHALCNTDH